ncbi:7-carboxy-7-deazaguanine synthase [Stakelama sp. CBK3Z-3]|uniref:7-carboxy-7-deazaguanine synthase n=1 Tax=Stakelama flava TaxID=2860338 RepID=A0ABS6XHZ2_9SPHN|nr:7-carboxy-7-deazaguanine synthase [Stakelama flava]
MSYAVKEMFLTLQGEGIHAGRRAVFIRFAGCNLWSGREQDRTSAICRFCDTDFVGMDGPGGGRFPDGAALAETAARIWGDAPREERFAVLTGGEPMLQVDDGAVDALHAQGFTIAIESNGTIAAHPGIDWICISPKAGSEVVQRRGDELKLVWPQDGMDIAALEAWDFANFLVQPMDSDAREENLTSAIAFAMERPRWRLTLQTHKMLGLP